MHTPSMDVFQRLASDLDTEARYLLLNAVRSGPRLGLLPHSACVRMRECARA